MSSSLAEIPNSMEYTQPAIEHTQIQVIWKSLLWIKMVTPVKWDEDCVMMFIRLGIN